MKEESKREENSKGVVVDSDNIEKHLFHFQN